MAKDVGSVGGETAEEKLEQYLEDDQLAGLLARMAAIEGHAISKIQLVMTQEGFYGAEISKMPRAERAIEIWGAVFPSGVAHHLTDLPTPDELPTLWVSEDSEQIYILTGQLSSGAFQCIGPDGEVAAIELSDAMKGSHLLLRPESGSKLDKNGSPKTAKGWFKFALLKRKHIFFEAAIATGVINILALGSSLYSMNIYDRVVPSRTTSTLWVLSIGVILAYTFDYILRQVRSRFVEAACREIDNELSSVFFEKMLSIRMDQRPQTIGTFASQLRQFETVRNTLTAATMFVLADAPFSLLFILIVALIAGPLAFIPLLLLPLALIIALVAKEKFSALAKDKVQESNRRNGMLVEVISGIESVKAAQGGWKFARRWDQINTTLSNNDLEMKHQSQSLQSSIQMIQQVLYIGIMVGGVYAIHAGQLTSGALIACTIIGSRALAPAASLAGIIGQWQSAKAALEVLENIMKLPSDGAGTERPVIPEICNGQIGLEKIKYAYISDAPLSLDVERLVINSGDRVVIMGPSGSGKSTLLKICSGLYSPTEGKVSLDNIDMNHLAPGFLREHIGYLPQDVWLFEGTLRDNITIGLPSPTDAQILRAAQLTGLISVIQNHPKGLALPITEGGRGLSVGQRQLVGLTRLLIAQPKIMLLDEPTAAMDSRLEQYVINQMTSNISQDSTFVLVTHKAELLRYGTRILILDKGKIVIDGPRDQVIERLKAKLPAQN